MRESPTKGAADSVPVSSFLSPAIRRVSERAALSSLTTHYSLPTTHYSLSCSTVHGSPVTSHKSRLFMRLPPLCRSQKSQLLCNQANPASFCQNTGVGGPLRSPRSDLSALCVALLPASHVFSATYGLFVSLCALSRARVLCFHQHTASFCKTPGVGMGWPFAY